MVESRRASRAAFLSVVAGLAMTVCGAMPAGVSLKPATAPATRPSLATTRQATRAAGTAGPTSRPATIAGPSTQPVISKKLEALASFAEPAISPDGAEIALVSGGDIWTVPTAGGEARLLISHTSNESHPRYSPDGKKLAFVSNRTGNGDIYILSFDSGDLKRLTFDDGREDLDGWSRDGQWIYFSSGAHDVGGTPDIYRVSAEGGTPMPVLADAYAAEFHAASSPDGKQLLFSAGGNGGRNWARRGHDHSDETDIWLMTDASGGAARPDFRRLTEAGDKNLWPMWASDGQSIYYVSDHGGAQNLWSRPADPHAGSAPRKLTSFKNGRVLFPDITPDGRTIVFERDFGIWKFDVAGGKTTRVKIHLRGSPAAPGVEHFNFGSSLSEMSLSPDGRKVAVVAHGEVFASARDGGEAVRITQTAAIESHVVWSRDSRRLVYVSNRDGPRHLFLYDFNIGREYRLTNGKGDDTSPIFSPDDDRLAFQRDGKELMIINIYTRNETVLASGEGFDRPPFDRSPSPYAWSPKGDWIAFISSGLKGFDNVYIVPTGNPTTRPFGSVWRFVRGDKSTPMPRQVTFMANAGSNAVSWSPDGTFLLFGTGQRTEEYQMARVDLIPRTPRFREDVFRDLFREVPRTTLPGRRLPPTTPEPSPPAPATLPATTLPAPSTTRPSPLPKDTAPKLDFDDIRQRLTLLPISADVGLHVISPDGKTVLFSATSANQQNLYTYSLDDSVRDPAPRQLTSTSGYKHSAQFSPDGRDVYYIDGGRLYAVPLDTRISRQIGVSAEMDVDFASEKIEVFHQAWQYLHDNFFDPNFNGLNWEAVGEMYAPRVAGARTPDELRRLLSLMVGELNASHVGASGGTNTRYSTARLGISFDRADYEKSGRLRVTSVVPLGPAAVAGIKAGDVIVGIDRLHVTNHTNLEEILDQKIGKRVTLIVTDREGHNARDIALLAIDFNTERALLYRAWVESRRQYVDRISGGRLGYVHIPDMTESALARLNTDLDSENQTRDGIVIDIRNNRGGFVNGLAIDIFARRNYLTMTRRGFPPVAARTLLGQRAVGMPAVLVTNRFTISDAEDFTEGFRSLKLGKVVGEPTAGAVVFTSNVTLMDGTTFRIPETLVTDNTGTPLEMHPRPVDVTVSRTIGDGSSDRDIELDTAVRELLKDLSNNPATNPGNLPNRAKPTADPKSNRSTP